MLAVTTVVLPTSDILAGVASVVPKIASTQDSVLSEFVQVHLFRQHLGLASLVQLHPPEPVVTRWSESSSQYSLQQVASANWQLDSVQTESDFAD